MSKALHEQNRRSWNLATRAHESHKPGQAAWLAGGGTTLFPEELALLGDLRGRRVVHLQCNSGADTVSIALGGAEAHGVDISDDAITYARALASEAGARATFERADVYDWLAAGGGGFDLAFASYGALCWLSDLRTWARGVAAALAPGGRLVVMEFHPALYLVEPVDGRWTFAPTRGGGGGLWEHAIGIGDYVGDSGAAIVPSGFADGVREFVNPEPCREWEWSLADVVDAIAQAGLVIETVREWPYSNGCRFFPEMIDLGARRWAMPDDAPKIPLMYGLAARR